MIEDVTGVRAAIRHRTPRLLRRSQTMVMLDFLKKREDGASRSGNARAAEVRILHAKAAQLP